jgi:hypothetical protein
MPIPRDIDRKETTANRKRLAQLEKRYDALFEQLYNDPSNDALSREVRLIEVDIVRLTGEKTIHY